MNTYTKNHDNTLVTILGDSVGKGIYTDNGRLEVLPENPAKVTAEKFGITIDNRSKYGQTLSRLTARGEENALFSQNSAATGQTRKIAVVELGGNDADFDWKEVASSPEADHAPKTDPERFTDLYRELILKLGRRADRVHDSARAFRKVFFKRDLQACRRRSRSALSRRRREHDPASSGSLQFRDNFGRARARRADYRHTHAVFMVARRLVAHVPRRRSPVRKR